MIELHYVIPIYSDNYHRCRHDLYDLLHDDGLRDGLCEWASVSPTKSFRTAFDFAEKDQYSTGTLCRGLQVHQGQTSDEGFCFDFTKFLKGGQSK